MKSLLFCTSFFGAGRPHPDADTRYRRWLEFYSRNGPAVGADRLVFIDDGSDPSLINLPGVPVLSADNPLPDTLPPGPVLFRFGNRLGRTHEGFPGWWRSFTFSLPLAERFGYRKILHIESDLFILSQRLADDLKNRRQGWVTYAQGHNRNWLAVVRQPRRRWETLRQYLYRKARFTLVPFRNRIYPECALQVIGEDSFGALRDYLDRGPDFWKSSWAPELILPFTEVNRRFVGQRYGEYFFDDYPRDADYVAQAAPPWEFAQTLRAPVPEPAEARHVGA